MDSSFHFFRTPKDTLENLRKETLSSFKSSKVFLLYPSASFVMLVLIPFCCFPDNHDLDITELRRMEEELEKKRKHLEEMYEVVNLLKGFFDHSPVLMGMFSNIDNTITLSHISSQYKYRLIES